MRNKKNQANIDNTSPALYPDGRIKDNDGSGNGTPVNEQTKGDIHEFFDKLLRLYSITHNDLPDNEQNGYQTIEALRAFAGKNDTVLNIGSSAGSLTVPVKVNSLLNNEVLECIATVDKGSETNILGTQDNVSKTASFRGDFKSGEYLLLINLPSSILVVRKVDAGNLLQVASDLGLLTAANQAEEDAGTIENKGTTPKTNKAVFSKRVNGDQSGDYLAKPTSDQDARNGLMSAAQAEILANIAASRIKNVGGFSGLDAGGNTQGQTFAVFGDIDSATLIDNAGGNSLIEVVFANAMDNANYKLSIDVESQGDFFDDNEIQSPVFRPVNATTARISIEETQSVAQTLKIHIDAIQL